MTLSIDKLSIDIDDKPLFAPLSFTVNSGDIVHIQGANGSGKTTLLRCLIGLKKPTAGSITWQQLDLQDHKELYWQQMSYLGHHLAIKPRLSVRENGLLNIKPGVRVEDVDVALAQVGLSSQAEQLAGECSAGQKQRLGLVRVLLQQRPLWILDEPLTALDQISVQCVADLIAAHAQQGGAVVFTSHQQLPLKTGSLNAIILSAALETIS